MKDVEFTAKRLIDLQKLLYEFLDIKRLIYYPESIFPDRRESDTEHSYHLAMLAWYVSGELPGLDSNKVIKYALAHDLVEIHAGDVMAIGRTESEQKIKDEKEAEAVNILSTEWEDFPDLIDTIKNYESQSDQEAIFVKSLDKITTVIHNIIGEGKTWKNMDLHREEIMKIKDEKTKPSNDANKIWQVFKSELMSHPEWFNEGKS